MNAVQNVATDLTNVVPTGRTTAKTASQRFDAVRERVFNTQGAQSAPSPQKEQSAETAAEQGLVVPVPPQAVATPVEAETTAQSHDVLQGVNAVQQQLSKCCDLPEPVGGIADILEGFGLLNRSGDVIELTTEGQAFLAQLFQELMGAEQQATGSSPYAAGNEAGMLNTAIPEETQQALQLLIKEYLCSLENANSPGTVPVSVSAEHQEALPLPLAGAARADLKDSVENLPVQPTADAANVIVSAAASSEQSTVIQKTPLERLVQALTQRNDDAAPQEGASQEQKLSSSGHELMQAGAFHSPLSLQRPVLTSVNPGAANVPPTQADMAQNISNIVEEMSFRADQEIQEFSVSLKPAHLGELSITLTKSSDGLLAQIKATDASTKGLIQNEVATLTAQLKDKGIEIRQIEVVYEAPAFTTDMRQNEGRKDTSSSAPHKSRLYRIGAAQESYGAAIDSTAITASPLLMDSSVEYQA